MLGSLEVQLVAPRFRLEAGVARDVLEDTAQILSNDIRYHEERMALTTEVSDRLAVDTRVELRQYSDSNESAEYVITPKYTLRLRDPRVRIGYRRSFLGFDRQSGSGYFDPDQMISDELVLLVDGYTRKFNGGIELFFGDQAINRFNTDTHNRIAGYSGWATYNMTDETSLEFTFEGGDFALKRTNAFKYHYLGLGLSQRF